MKCAKARILLFQQSEGKTIFFFWSTVNEIKHHLHRIWY